MNKTTFVLIIGALVLGLTFWFFLAKKNQQPISLNLEKTTITISPQQTTNNQQTSNVKGTMSNKQLSPPTMQIDPSKQYSAILNTTEGQITIRLYAESTPKTVNNFVYLAKNNFYDATIFHRVIKGFMIQGGDPNGDGTGGPGYRFDDEPFEGKYSRGIVAMANAGPNTNGSQFFIMHQDKQLPPNYVAFAEVSKGMEVVDKIANAPVTANNHGEPSKPVKPVVVEKVEIIEK